MKNEQQSQHLSLKVDPHSTFRSNFLQPATNVSVAWQVDHAWWKTGNIGKNLQRNSETQQVEGFCVSYLVALNWETFASATMFPGHFTQTFRFFMPSQSPALEVLHDRVLGSLG